jgi:hypothetical protein
MNILFRKFHFNLDYAIPIGYLSKKFFSLLNWTIPINLLKKYGPKALLQTQKDAKKRTFEIYGGL